jgi:PAS domain S-box-containing protein
MSVYLADPSSQWRDGASDERKDQGRVNEPIKRWARARMAPETWDRLLQTRGNAAAFLHNAYDSVERWISIGSDHVTSMRTARLEPWRWLFAAITIIVPLLIMAAISTNVDPAVPALILIAPIALSTYVADWVGGVAALIVGIIGIDLLFVGEPLRVSFPEHHAGYLGLAAFIVAAGLIIATIEHLKYDRAEARTEASAMRAGNTALNAVEIAAASRPPGDYKAYLEVLTSLLTAMVRVNRMTTGAIYLLDDTGTIFTRAAAYADAGDEESEKAREIPANEGFVGRVARERRPIALNELDYEPIMDDVFGTNPHIQSVMGVPLISASDRVVGVAWVGLYVPNRYSQTAIARLQALGHRTVAFLEAATIADAQEARFDRVQDNHRRLQSVIQAMPEAVMVARPPHGTIVATNAAAQRMFGLAADPLVVPVQAQHLQIALEDDHPETVQPILRVLDDGKTVTGVELTVRQKGGDELPVVASAAPLLTDSGELDAVVAVFQDVRPLKEAQRLRDAFLSVVSHELRSPLTPILGYSQLLERDIKNANGPANHIDWLHIMQRHVNRMTRLVDDLLDVSRLRAGRLKTRPALVDVIDICRNVVASHEASSPLHRVELRSDYDHLPAMLDGDRIHQVVDNLVSNAIKYTPEGPITVDVAGQPDEQPNVIHIAVSDSGPGIPTAIRDSLFTPFFRAREASESAVPGLGLGLFICHELIAAHGGTITIDDAPGGGARFDITLPVSAAPPQRLSA